MLSVFTDYLSINLSQIAQIATAAGVIIGVITLFLNYRQIAHTRRITEGQFLLEIERMSSSFDNIHRHLRPGGKWSDGENGPETPDEWCAVEDYMGFFEHCELLIASGALSEDSFSKLFLYRVVNIVHCYPIRKAKLVDESEHWELFLDLVARMGLKKPTQKNDIKYIFNN